MRREYYILIDIGTGNSRVALGDNFSKIVDMEGFINRYDENLAYTNSLVLDIDFFIDSLTSSIKKILDRNSVAKESIEVVICDSPRQSFVLLDEEKKVVLAIPNVDNRAKDLLGEFSSIDIKREVYKKSGHPLTEDFGAMKLYATNKIEADLYKNIRYITSISEWLGYLLTGELTMEYSHAAETQLFNIVENNWDDWLCNTFKIDINILPRLVGTQESLGQVKKDILDKFDIKSNPNFIVGGADTQAALESILDLEAYSLAIVSGTTSPVIRLDNKPFYDEINNVWNGKHCGGSKYMVEANPGVTGLNYQNLKRVFAPNLSYDHLEKSYLQMENPRITCSLTSQITMKASGPIRGGFFLNPPSSSNIEIEDFMYSVLCDNVCAIYEKYKILKKKDEDTSVLACGGGFKSRALAQNLANLLGTNIVLEEGYEQASLRGLLNISRSYRGYKINEERVDKKVYRPNEDEFIHKYYREWSKNINYKGDMND